jgi:hypothetical protein
MGFGLEVTLTMQGSTLPLGQYPPALYTASTDFVVSSIHEKPHVSVVFV